MKKFFCLFLISLLAQMLWAQSGEGYDPQSPPDPDVYYHLTLEASPRTAGSVSPNSMQSLAFGKSISCSAYPNTGYTFKCWMVGDEVVSTDRYFYYTMPDHDVVLTAHFDREEYNPENPGDPFVDGYQHKVNLYATPSAGGSFNSSSFYMTEGRTTYVYAYPSAGFRFVSWKQNGKIVSTENPMEVQMGQEDIAYTAQFVYDPQNPGDPGENFFNPATGELVIDAFEPGRLNSAIYTTLGTYDNYKKVKSVTIIGTMQSSDFGFLRNMVNCNVADLSRTTGYDIVPDYAFEGASALKTIVLPFSVESIGNYAFSGCSNLTTLYCYALTPSTVYSTTFYGVPSSMKVLVPALSLELYQSANYWKDFVLAALDGVTNTLTISLPEDAKDGRYKNMILELDNITSGQVSRMLITDRTRYSFANLIHNTKYNVYVKTAKSVVLGEIQDVEIGDKDVETAFSQLKQPQTVTMSVVNGKGENLTENTEITWLDENGNYLATGNTVSGYIDGTLLKYRISLLNEAALYYVTPQDSTYEIKASDNEFNCVLTPLQLVAVTGYVKNANTKEGIYDASVSISQQTSSKQSRTIVAKTDVNGMFKAEVYNSPACISCSAYDYVNKSVEIESLTVVDGKASIGDIMMNSIVGATINISLTYQGSVLENERAEVQNWYSDSQNVVYSIFNETTGKEISLISNRFPQLVLYEGVSIGDQLRLTAKSKKDAFMPVHEKVNVKDAQTNVIVPIVQKGQLMISLATPSRNGTSFFVYNDKGVLIAKSNCFSNNDRFFDLNDGNYSVVAIENNTYISSIYSLAQIEQIGLERNVDYVRSDIEVKSGIIRNIQLSAIPKFDINKFRFVDKSKTNTFINKKEIVTGNYLTVGCNVGLEQEYLGDMKDVAIVLDVPEEARIVNNSVMVNGISSNYTCENNRLIIPLTTLNTENSVKFCIIPTSSGNYFPSFLINYNIENKDYLVPLGDVNYHVSNANILADVKTSSPNIWISGSSLRNSNIKIYDNNALVANFKSGSCEWSANCKLVNTYNLSKHQIYAQITTEEGASYETTTRTTVYDKDAVLPVTLKMILPIGQIITFDYLTKKTSLAGYSPCSGNFSFLVEFTKNSPSIILSSTLYIETESGNVIKLPTTYDAKTDRWTNCYSFSSYDQPINISLDYLSNYKSERDLAPIDNPIIKLERDIAAQDSLLNLSNQMIDDLISKLESKTLTSEEFKNLFESIVILYDVAYSGNAEDQQIIDRLNGLENDIRLEEIAKERLNRDHTPSNEFEQIEKQLTTPINQSISESNRIPEIYVHTTKPLLNIQNSQINTINSGWDVEEPESTRVLFTNNNGDNIIVDIERQLPMPSDNDEAYHQWAENAQRLVSENISDITGLANTAISAAAANTLQEIYRSTREISFSRLLIRNQLSYENGSLAINPNHYKPLLEDIRLENGRLINAKNVHSTLSTLSKVGGGIGALMGGWSIGSSIRNGLNINDEWNGLIDKIKECPDPAAKSLAIEAENHKNWIRRRYTGKGVADVATTGLGIAGTVSAPETLGLSLLLNGGCFLANLCTSHWENEFLKSNDENWNDVLNKYSALDCKEDEDPDDYPESEFRPLSISRDPSGYVYEGIASNRLEGVTATAFYKEQVEDMYGDLHDNIVKWDAEEYAQQNPLFTDENGMYAWDVPQGLWQVKFEKEGYETTYSEWLPVPPPQLDVNIAMTQVRQPEVKSARAYEDAVEVEFDKYMIPATLTEDNIYVTANGKKVEGTILLLNEEVAYEGKAEKYASKIRFNANAPFAAKEVTLTVANRVKSYAGIQMQESFSQTFDVEQEVKSIETEANITVTYDGDYLLTVKAMPAAAAAGKTLIVRSSSSMIATTDAESYVLDKKGEAQVLISAELPGTTGITFTIDGYDLSVTTMVNVQMPVATDVTATPTASIASGTTVERGTKVVLSCETPDATIYYTLDGSCPCDEATRLIYTAPIVINESVTIKAMAVAPDMEESQIAEYVYIVTKPTGVDEVTLDETIKVYPLPVRDKLNVTAGGELIKSVTLVSTNGSVVAKAAKPETIVTLDVSTLAPGIYFINVATEDKNYSRKIMKVE